MSATSDDDILSALGNEGDDALRQSAPLNSETAELTSDVAEPDDEEEFSLSHLSQAYAKVLRGNDRPAQSVLLASIEAGSELGQAEQSGNGPDSTIRVAFEPPIQTTSDRESRDNAGCPISPESIVEALVFVGLPGDESLTLKKLSSLLRDVSPKEIKAIIKQLNTRYENEQSAYRIKLDGSAVRMELDESMISFQQAFSRVWRGVKLNPSTIEVLAIIAYNQPITREKIDETRKRPSSAIVTQLVRRGLVAAVNSEQNSQRQDYVTTDKFLELFHLADLSDLPKGADVSDLDELLS